MRKEVEVTIQEGRDAGKKFKVVEMPAFQMDRWATRALIALGNSSKTGLATLGTMDVASILKSFSQIDYEQSEPLLQELLECCSFEKDGTSITLKKEFVNEIVEDWVTLFKLRMEALKLNLGFLEQGGGDDTN